MSKTYYIFRHGETFATRKKSWYWFRLYTAQILDEGKPSIIKLAEYLKQIESSFNVSSTFLRCRQTAEIVSEITGKKFEFDRRIREYAFEFPWAFKKRLIRFMKDMENSDSENIIICTHSAVIVGLIQYLVGGKISLKKQLIAPLPGVLTIIKDKKVKEINFNT